MTQFTASEMRAEAHRHANEVEDMLNAYADLLEAREKAEPVGYVTIDGLAVWYKDGSFSSRPKPGAELYTHPAPSDAERLAEPYYIGWCRYKTHDGRATTLHLCDSDDEGAFRIYRHAHSAKVQPPANQDKPVYAISRSMHSYYTQDEEEARQAEFDGANVQRIPAQPPAASVTDGFVFERVNMGRGNERYVGLADGSEGTTVQEDGDGPGDTRSRLLWRIADAALAAQENPNG